MPDKYEILAMLPRVQGVEQTIHADQSVRDIMREVMGAHEQFAGDYKRIAGAFVGGDTEAVCRRLFNFCKKNIRYVVEGDALQTSRSPGVLLSLGSGDCKHYAGFIAGVIDAMGGIDWCYRFARYDFFEADPGHVFVVVNDQGRELWIDPVLQSFDQRSTKYFSKTDKKMALKRIYGVGDSGRVGAVEFFEGQYYPPDYFVPWISSYQNKIFGSIPWNSHPVRFFVDGKLFSMPEVEAYKLKEQGKAVPLVPQGLTIAYPPHTWKGKPIPADLLRPKITAERAMIITTPSGSLDMKAPAGYMNPSIPGLPGSDSMYTYHALIGDENRLLQLVMAAAGIIQMAYQPYPDAERLQRWTHRVLDLRADNNYLLPMDIKTVAGNFIEGIKDAVEVIGKGFIKFIGIIPRTAFLQLLRLNGFGMATNLYKNLQGEGREDIRRRWEGFGGQFNMLENAARDGSAKKALLGSTVGAGGGGLVAALTAAAPLIALLAKFLKSYTGDEGDKIVDKAFDSMKDLLNKTLSDPYGVADGMGGKTVQENIPGGTINIPPDSGGIAKWLSDNPITAGIAVAGVVILGSSIIGRKRA